MKKDFLSLYDLERADFDAVFEKADKIKKINRLREPVYLLRWAFINWEEWLYS